MTASTPSGVLPLVRPTHLQAHLIAQELTLKRAADNPEKLTRALVEARVDLNPHQVDAALFAFKNPLSKGAILADEVGLGKTIEAGLLATQYWAEGKQRLLVLCPASLRTQWRDELADKFFLDAVVLDSKSAKGFDGNPFDQVANGTPRVVIASYHYASRLHEALMTVPWDLAILDEAHRLRNVYKGATIGTNIKMALQTAPKVLLTATPLQNSLNELYGLVSIIVETAFGDPKTFSRLFARVSEDGDRFDELKARLAPLCHRTLRRQVVEYVSYTNREPLTQEFLPTDDEQELYDLVSEYLWRNELQALPPSQRTLITLVLRKLLASSTYAIAGALDTMVRRLERDLRDWEALLAADTANVVAVSDVESVELADELNDLELDSEFSDEEVSAFTDTETEHAPPPSRASLDALAGEIAELTAFRDLAQSIEENAKGQALLEALQSAFARGVKLGAARKAVIFTESRRTQQYLVDLLSANGYGGKIVRFSGTNSDPDARATYDAWRKRHAGTDRITGSRAIDMRAALVESFRGDAEIMVATEAAAEGINLQFCSILVNYDLPWNPQRVEQRIGRCHRYGQKNDVLVVNFLNKSNAADVRVYELLAEKFKLFEGVFGASDDVLGAIENGVDIERRIADIYQRCRSHEEVDADFEQLQLEFADEIDAQMSSTRTKLIEHFDAQVHDRLKVRLYESKAAMDRHQEQLVALLHFASGSVVIDADGGLVTVKGLPPSIGGPTRAFALDGDVDRGHHLRMGDPAVAWAIQEALRIPSEDLKVAFDYSAWDVTAIELAPLLGKYGTLRATRLTIEGKEREEHLLVAAIADDGTELTEEQIARLLTVPAAELPADPGSVVGATEAADRIGKRERELIDSFQERTALWMDAEYEKLDRWADDERARLRAELRELEADIKVVGREVREAGSAPDRLKLRQRKLELDKRRDQAQRDYDDRVAALVAKQDGMLDEIKSTLDASHQTETLCTIRWTIT